ncbi:MAG: endonuclease III [Candidatus Omnitrophota bacterium]
MARPSASTIDRIVRILKKEYPSVKTALEHRSALDLLVATILSAQCTDKRVNIVTKPLFQKYKKASDYAAADTKVFENEIRSTGFYRNKAKNIIAAARKIVKDFGGNVPDSMEELTSLPGVARKTANIVLYGVFGKQEGIAVDTHVKRLSGRLGLTKQTDPVKIEQDLMKLVDRNDWGPFNFLLVEHGRAVCDARKPNCPGCVLAKLCPSFKVYTA